MGREYHADIFWKGTLRTEGGLRLAAAADDCTPELLLAVITGHTSR